jgi:hypothetical protein
MVAAQRLQHPGVSASGEDAFQDHVVAGVQGVAAHHVDQPDVHAARLVQLAQDVPADDILTDDGHAAAAVRLAYPSCHGGLARTRVAADDDENGVR